MTGNKPLAKIFAIGVLALAAGILIYSAPPRRTAGAPAPYYKRTGFLSTLLTELEAAPAGIASIHVPEGFEVVPAAAPGLVTYPMFIAFDDRGRLFVCESAGRNI